MPTLLDQIMNINESNDSSDDISFDKEPTGSDKSKSSIEDCGTLGKGKENDEINESMMLTEQELEYIYSECVAEVIRESKAAINKKYKEKKQLAKSLKAKKLAKSRMDKRKADKDLAIKEAADPNMVINQIFDAF